VQEQAMPQRLVDVVEQARSGDRSALALLYTRFAPLVRMVCFERTNDWHAALDLTHDVFLTALRDLQRLRQAERFQPWLLGIARHRVAEYLKAKARGQRHPPRLDGELLAPVVDPAQEEQQHRLRQAIEQLPEPERLAIRLFHLEGLAVREIVEVLDMPMRTVYATLARARQRLQRRLEP
jgi:RNA polymerase sigma-70 factor, ECF subfamily